MHKGRGSTARPRDEGDRGSGHGGNLENEVH